MKQNNDKKYNLESRSSKNLQQNKQQREIKTEQEPIHSEQMRYKNADHIYD